MSLGGVPLFDLDEGAFSAATFEMLQRHDFITTYLNGEPRFDKPILIYWLQALSVSMFGLNEWALRLPSAMAATGWMLTLYYFSRRLWSQTTALYAVTFAAGSLLVVVIGRAAIADALLNLFLALSLLSILDYTQQADKARLRWIFVWMALGVLTKGPIAILIPLMVSVIWFASYSRLREWWGLTLQPLPWLLFFVIVLPWYLLELQAQGQAFIDGFFLKHNINRFSSTMEGHGGHLYYYLPVLLVAFMPFTGLLFTLFSQLRQQLTDPVDRFLWIWFGFVLVFFSVSQTQLPHYLLYGASPIFLLMARHRKRLSSRIMAWLPAVAFYGVMFIFPELLIQAAQTNDNTYVQAVLQNLPTAMGTDYRLWTGAALCLSIALFFVPRRSMAPYRGLQVLAFAQVFVIVYALLPAVATLQQQAVKNAALFARTLSEPVVMWRIRMPSFTVYRGKVTPERPPEPGEVVFTRIDKLQHPQEYELLYQQSGIILARPVNSNMTKP